MSTGAPEPLTPTRATDQAIYAVAGGNHVTVLLDRCHTASAQIALRWGIEFWTGPVNWPSPRAP